MKPLLHLAPIALAGTFGVVTLTQAQAGADCLRTSIRPNGEQFQIMIANMCAAKPIVVLMRQKESKAGAGVAPVAPKRARLVNLRIVGGKTDEERRKFAEDDLQSKEFLVLGETAFAKACGDVTKLSSKEAVSCFLKAYE